MKKDMLILSKSLQAGQETKLYTYETKYKYSEIVIFNECISQTKPLIPHTNP